MKWAALSESSTEASDDGFQKIVASFGYEEVFRPVGAARKEGETRRNV